MLCHDKTNGKHLIIKLIMTAALYFRASTVTDGFADWQT
jgi:hypothetical protein